MAYYNYKRVVERLPKDFAERYETKHGCRFEMTSDYDGDLWIAAADHIDDLTERLAKLEADYRALCNASAEWDQDEGRLKRIITEKSERLAKLEAVAEAAYRWFKISRSDEDWTAMIKALRAAGYLEGQDRGE